MIQLENKYKPGFKSSGFFLLLMFLLLSCQQNHQEHKVSKVKGSQLSAKELENLYIELYEIESAILNFPQKVELRKELLQKSKNIALKKLIAAGYGTPPSGDQSETVKRRLAEQAAFVDACRWLGYLELWDQNINKPDFGSIQTKVENVKKIHVKFSSTHHAEVLVELAVQ